MIGREATGDRPWVGEALAFVRSNLQRTIRKSEVAAHVGRSARRLDDGIRQATGRCLCAHVQHLRLEEAKKLLAGGSLPVKDVAAAVGFTRFDYFCARFRRATGRTAGEYRRRHRVPAPRPSPPDAGPPTEIAFEAAFESDRLARDWEFVGGAWSPRNGELRAASAGTLRALLRREIPLSCRIEIELMRSREENRSHGATVEILITDAGVSSHAGYRALLGARGNAVHSLGRADLPAALRSGSLAYDAWHRVVLTNLEGTIAVEIDGREVLVHEEMFPLPWRERCRLIVGGWDADLRIRRLRILALPPPFRPPESATGDAHAAEGDYDRALDAYETSLRSLERKPAGVPLLLKAGMSALRLGFGIRARSYLDRFAAERPSSAWGAVAASESFRARAGRFDASEVLREARRLLEYATSGEQFEIVQTTLDLEVVASRDRGEYERALGLARAVYDASPRDLPLAGGLAREVTSCLAWLGRHEEAAAFAEEARASGKVDPTRETDMGATVALSLAAAGRHADALRLLERLSASPLPGELDARRMISVAIVRQSAGELDRAVAAWLDVPRLHPDIARVAESARLGAAELLAFAGRHDAARHLARRSERRPRRAAGEGHRLPPSLFAIAGDFAALLLILEDRTWGRREPGKDTFRDQVLHGILEEIVGDPERSRRNLEALVRSHGEGPFWRFVRPASYLLGKVSADDLRGNTAGFCLFAPELGSSSLFYMLSLVMRKRGDRREERLLLRLAIETDPWNYWPALLARRELGKLGPGMKRFLGKR